MIALPTLRHGPFLSACTRTLLAAAVLWPGAARAEVLYLHDGRRIDAEVLKETADKVFVDLGFDVVIIPKDRIQRIEVESEDAPAAVQRTGDLYSTALLPRAPIPDLAKRFEEAVVRVNTPRGMGSGFIINTDGYVITNVHVIENETDITLNIFHHEGAAYRNERIKNVRIVATNPFMDVALLKFDPPVGMEVTASFLAREQVNEGETVFAIGNPLGLERSVSQGIVSKKNRREDDGLLYVQTTTQINPGNSGGPLFNTRGEVVGVTNAGYRFAEGLNYAIPIRYVIDFLVNRDAYTYNLDNPSSGHQYLQPAARVNLEAPDFLRSGSTPEEPGESPGQPGLLD